LVIGLTGKWGSGKSTLLSFIKSYIEKEHNSQEANEKTDFVVIDFNPWMYNGQKELQSIFLKEVAMKAGNQVASLRDFLGKIADRTLVSRLISSVKVSYQDVSVSLENFNKIFSESLEDLREDVNNDLILKNRKLYIFIDDLDRLEPQSIIEILQLIRLNASFKNTVYFLAFDKEYVHQTLLEKYGKNGPEYLSKIVQIDYAVPEATSERIETIFFSELEKFKKNYSLTFSIDAVKSLWSVYELKSFFTTLRNVYRYFNSLRFRLPIIHAEIEVEDFIILEAFRMFRSQVYQDMVDDLSISHSEQSRQKYVDQYTRQDNQDLPVRKLMTILKDNSFLGRHGKKGIARRLLDQKYTEQYFALEIPTNDISLTEVELFISDEGRRQKILNDSTQYGRLKSLFKSLGDKKLQETHRLNDSRIFSTIINYWQHYNEGYLENAGNILAALLNLCYLKSDKKEAFDSFLHAIYTNETQFNIACFHLLYMLRVRFKDKKLDSAFYHFYNIRSNYIEEFYKKYLENWGGLIINDTARQQYGALTKLLLKEYASHHETDYIKRLASDIFKNEDKVIALMLMIVSDSQEEDQFEINWEYQEALLPSSGDYLQDFIKKLSEVNVENLAPLEKKTLDFYLREHDKSDLDKKLNYTTKEMAARESLYGKEHTSIANNLHSIGEVYFDKKDYPNAAKYYGEAITMLRKCSGPTDPRYKHYTESLLTVKRIMKPIKKRH
jgi:hypothetical protein